MKFVLASNNIKKISEMRRILEKIVPGVELLSLADVGYIYDIEENGKTFTENALIKARIPASLGYIGIADDSGLVVDALGGAPGVYSARYAGDGHDDKANKAKLLRELDGVADENRTAHFICVIAWFSRVLWYIPDYMRGPVRRNNHARRAWRGRFWLRSAILCSVRGSNICRNTARA